MCLSIYPTFQYLKLPLQDSVNDALMDKGRSLGWGTSVSRRVLPPKYISFAWHKIRISSLSWPTSSGGGAPEEEKDSINTLRRLSEAVE